MNVERMRKISRETGLSLDGVAETQLDDNLYPKKYVTRRVDMKNFLHDITKVAIYVAAYIGLTVGATVGAFKIGEYREEHKYDHLSPGWHIVEELPSGGTISVYISEEKE